MKEVAGIQVPGTPWATPPEELAKLAGYGRDINAARAEARRLLKEAGAEGLSFTLLNRAVPQPYEPVGIWLIDQWRQVGLNVKQVVLETAAWLQAQKNGDFEVSTNAPCNSIVEPDMDLHWFLSTSPVNFSRHKDTVMDELYTRQSRAQDPGGAPAAAARRSRSGSTTRKSTTSTPSSGSASSPTSPRCAAGRSRPATTSISSSTRCGSASRSAVMIVPLTLADFLERAEAVYGDRVAVVDEPDPPGGGLGRVTYARFAAMARSLAVALDELGVEEGARVAIVSPNAGRFLVALFGVSVFGRILVPVNFRLNADEIRYIIEHSGSTVALVDPEMEEIVRPIPVKHRLLLGTATDAALFGRTAASPRYTVRDENATVSVNYTSGTTARPKGVQLTHRGCWLNAVTFGWHVGVSDRDVYLHTLPTFHCNGWGMPYAVTAMGARHVVIRKIDGEEILRRIDAEGVTLLNGAPAVVAAVLGAAQARRERGEPMPGRGPGADGGGGGPAAVEDHRAHAVRAGLGVHPDLRAHRDLAAAHHQPGARGVGRSRPRGACAPARRAGVPAVGVRMAVDKEGEILARSNHVYEGYWNQPEETAKAIVDGWFHTGDGGHEDGAYIVIADRKKDVIITGGENVSSIEVEDCLFQHPAVLETAVIGVPDEKWGETIKALVVLRPGQAASERDLIEFCRGRMAHFKCPTSIEFRDALSRTATGKLQKFKLREPFWAGRDRRVS